MTIKIKIEREITERWKANENVITKKTPTAQKDRYDGTAYVEEYEVREVDKSSIRTETLLTQEIADETQFDLKAVISAINKLSI
jgi:hypothetical protein